MKMLYKLGIVTFFGLAFVSGPLAMEPKHAPAIPTGFDALPLELKRGIILDVVDNSESLDQAIDFLQKLSHFKTTFDTVINNKNFTETMIEHLHKKYPSASAIDLGLALIDLGLPLGTTATDWLKNYVRNSDHADQTIQTLGRLITEKVNPAKATINENKIKFLLSSKIDLDEPYNGKTLLTNAVRANKPKVVRLLLDTGANPNYVVLFEGSALAPAFEPSVISFFSTLDHAILNGNPEIIKMLQDAGAKPGKELHPTHSFTY